MRDFILCYINGERHEIRGEQAFLTASDYLRYIRGLTGTKVVCAEGDCAACTIVYSRFIDGEMNDYQSINSCISFMYLMDQCHLITVEGLVKDGELHEAQSKMRECHGSQCGYCTPGFIGSLAYMAEDLKKNGKQKTQQKVKNYLTGNLCRCTGYEPIINAGMEMNLNKVTPLSEMYGTDEITKEFAKISGKNVHIGGQNKEVHLPHNVDEALKAKGGNVRITSGATDLGVQYNKGRYIQTEILSLNNISECYKIENKSDSIDIGAKASLTAIEKACEKDFPEFSRMLHIFAAPGIKNAGTLVGNLVNASPIADTIPFLLVNEAMLTLASEEGTREIEVNKFFLGGYKELDLKPEELVTKVSLPKTDHEYKLYKVSLRKDLDISAVTFAARYKLEAGKITDLNLAFGGVGPIVIRTKKLEQEIIANGFNPNQNYQTLLSEISPMSDLRGSKEFRNQVACNLLTRFFDEVINTGEEASL